MSGQRFITVLDFDKKQTRAVSAEEWRRERDEGCCRAGHIFAYHGWHLTHPPDGTRCICGDVEWRPPAKQGTA